MLRLVPIRGKAGGGFKKEAEGWEFMGKGVVAYALRACGAMNFEYFSLMPMGCGDVYRAAVAAIPLT